MNNLKKIRNKLGISQEKLARLVNVSTKTIYRIENNESTDVKTAIKIAKILNTTVEEIFIEEKRDNK